MRMFGSWHHVVRLTLLVALAISALGCRDEAVQSAQVEVPLWTAILPGRNEPLALTLPRHFDNELPRVASEYTLRAQAEVPPGMRGLPLTFALPKTAALATLRVDGEEAVPVEPSMLDTYRASGPQRWRIPAAASRDGTLDLELRVIHRMGRSAWIDAAPVLTTHPLGGAGLAAVQTFDLVAGTGALAAGIVVSLLYGFLFASLTGRRRAAYGWFALGAASGLVYPAFILGMTQPLLGVYEASVVMTVLVVGSIAAMSFSRAYLESPPPHRGWWVLACVVAVIGVVTSDPFHAMLVMGSILLLVTCATTFAQLAFVARARRAGNRSKTLFGIAFAWPATMLLGVPDIVGWFGLGEPASGVRFANVAIMVLSVYQATALTREHLLSLKRADELNAELESRFAMLRAKHREVELLNDELRRQIAARSRELAEKLALVGDQNLGAPAVLEVGEEIEGRYRVIELLGEGGMGAVYEVERMTDGRHFALKALSGGGDAEALSRFAREAQICANVNHTSVVTIVDVDVAQRGFLFLVMELVETGATLHDVRRRNQDVPWTLCVLAQVAEGIAAIHAAGIVHRDLKPGNILLSRGSDGRRPKVKITDFGISSLLADGAASSKVLHAEPALPPASHPPPAADEAVTRDHRKGPTPAANKMELELPEVDDEEGATIPMPERSGAKAAIPRAKRTTGKKPLTRTGIIFGTPRYMAQEMAAGTKHATRASDVFALGIIAFELFTGRRPFVEAPVAAKLNGHPVPPAPSFREYCPDLDEVVADLLDRAMDHDPNERPTAQDLAVALRAAYEEVSAPP